MPRADPGNPEPLGLTLLPYGANIAVFSAHATSIEVCLFDATGQVETERVALPERTGDVFHGFLPDIQAGARYGLRAHGPYSPRDGHLFNAAKLLVDPYALALDRAFALHPTMFGTAADGVTRNDEDSAPFVPKGIATPAMPPAPTITRSASWPDTIIYELHVRGFTRTHPDIPEALRGTCAGLAHPAAIAHLTRLGITTVELMPLAAAIDEPHLVRHGLTNYWGYNPAALFVPDPRLAPGGMDELRATIAALHAEGIEVVVDVVLNHSGEGDARGPTVSLRGLDNATYYRAVSGDNSRYVDDTGCGNTLALDRPPMLRLAMDSLRHYAMAGVDGFRFDLATTLGRRDDGFHPDASLLQAIAQDPLLRRLKLIAEPWDVGPGGYQLGAFAAGWGEWNDRYRDTMRRYWRGDRGQIADLATRFAGSADIFASRSRTPSRSVNFITAHDGFTLADLVSHETKHNEANREDNRDGTNINLSWNHGVEGPTSDPAIIDARRRDARNLLATLLLSRGTPMLGMGDELGRTQHGNNNAYAQDNPLTWIDWENANHELVGLTAALTGLRKRHPALRADHWLLGAPADESGFPDVEWLHPDGRDVANYDWHRTDNHVLIAILYAPALGGSAADRVAVAFNASHERVPVRWPDARSGFCWHRVVDTASQDSASPSSPAAVAENDTLLPRSVVVLTEERDETRPARRVRVEPALLARVAAAAGIAPDWWDVSGRRFVVTPDTTRALLAAMGLPVDSTQDARERLVAIALRSERRRLPPVIVTRERQGANVAIADEGRAIGPFAVARITSEDGAEMELPFRNDDLARSTVAAVDGRPVARRMLALPALADGYHELRLDDDPECVCRIIVAPHRCFTPPLLREGRRAFGLAAHLYAARSAGDQGIGDFTTLADLAVATARAGGAIVGVNPLHALFAEDRGRASPYHPSDRRFLDPIYIDIHKLPDLAASPEARALLAASAGRIEALSARSAVDYAGVWDVKRAILEACFDAFEQRAVGDPLVVELAAFVAAGGASLRQYALFEALAAAHPRQPWMQWPAGLRRPDGPDIAGFAHHHQQRIRFALYLQWLADRQLGEAAAMARNSGLALGFYRDLAIGSAPDGAEAWANAAGMLARGASIGAPPDPFSVTGQIWHAPPPIPGALTGSGYAGFRELLATNMRHAGALRIDHVMGMTRLFWVPDGATASEGAYISYPLDDLLAVMALESNRARCLVVGEDLGTVPDGLRERLGAADVLSYRILWFEREGLGFKPPFAYPEKAATCISTHDLPTIAGWWGETDIKEKRDLALLSEADAARARSERLAEKHALVAAMANAGVSPATPIDPEAPHVPEVTAAIHRYACATPSALVLLQADDLAGETEALNLPGTDRERPNWRRRIGVDANALWDSPAGTQAVADFAAPRGLK